MKLNPESDTIEMLAKEILVAARTAPKAKGVDDIVTGLLESSEIETLATTMESLAEKKGEKFGFFKRDAKNVRDSDTVILIGLKSSSTTNLNCSACGFTTCAEMLDQSIVESDFKGPSCAFKLMDFGIALGSAAAKAKDLCIDNRLMYTAGAAAKAAKMIDADVVIGMPLSIKGKNIFFDRR